MLTGHQKSKDCRLTVWVDVFSGFNHRHTKSMTKYNIAVAGATGNIGRLILSILKEREFPCGEVYALASRASLGREVSFGETDILKAQALENFDFSQVDLAFFALNNDLAKQYIPNIAKSGCIVIDNSSHFRMDPTVPLIVPEVCANAN